MAIVITALVSSALTLLIVLVVAGLMGHEKKIKHEIPSLYTVADEQFQRSMGNLLPPAMREGNRITTLINGKRIFPAMLEAISSAQRTVCFETFIWWSGDIGHQFMEAFCERGRAGGDVVPRPVGYAERGVVGDRRRIPEDPAHQAVRCQRHARTQRRVHGDEVAVHDVRAMKSTITAASSRPRSSWRK